MSTEEIKNSWLSVLKPQPKLNLVEWAENNRVLSKEASSEPGTWKTSRVEVARGVMLAVTDPRVHTITIMACTQLLKTEFINNVIGYFIDQDPAPILVIQPNIRAVEGWSKGRLSPMLRDTPCLNGKVKEKARNGNNTLLYKKFPGGHIVLTGAESPTGLASWPIRIVLADEIDKYPDSAGKEGDPVALGEERAATFWNCLKVRTCSPTVKGKSRIEASYNNSDQRRFYVPCPHCGEHQILTWENVKWVKDKNTGEHKADTALYHCNSCGAGWNDVERYKAIAKGTWRQTAKFYCCNEEQEPIKWNDKGFSLCRKCGKQSKFSGHAGFHVNKIASPWTTLEEVVNKWLNSKGDIQKIKTFINTQLAEVWEEDIKAITVDESALKKRSENYDNEAVSNDIIIITAGVDVQEDRLEVQIIGWGLGEV